MLLPVGRGRRSKVRQCQFMRQTTTVGQHGLEEFDEDVEWVWLCGGCVAPPIQEMRLAVVWVVLCSGLDECVCSMAMWMLITLCACAKLLSLSSAQK